MNETGDRAYKRTYANRSYSNRAYGDNGGCRNTDNAAMLKGDTKQPYWWIWGVKQGKGVILGCYSTKEKAEGDAIRANFDTAYQIYSLPTKDKWKATSMIKYLRFQDDGNVLQGRMRHSI